MAERAQKRRRFYTLHTLVPFEEDHTHEFKGHNNLTQADIPPKSTETKSRSPISRALNAFLNTGNGGTVYCGILDNGLVEGMRFTQFQKDHMCTALEDLLENSYVPRVGSHRYRVKFVPVIEQHNSPTEINEILSYDSRTTVNPEARKREHVLRTHRYCWCEKDAIARLNRGQQPANYVVEITIKPWDGDDSRNIEPSGIGLMKAHPIHMDETGETYFRKQACMVKYTPQEVSQMSRHLVSEHYRSRIEELQEQIRKAKERAKGKTPIG